jgi:hypothetical protein
MPSRNTTKQKDNRSTGDMISQYQVDLIKGSTSTNTVPCDYSMFFSPLTCLLDSNAVLTSCGAVCACKKQVYLQEI